MRYDFDMIGCHHVLRSNMYDQSSCKLFCKSTSTTCYLPYPPPPPPSIQVSTSEYASADSPSPSSINCSLRFGMSAFSSPGTVPDYDTLQRSDTASTMRPGISTSSSTYASSEQVGSTTRLLLASRSPPLRSHQRVDLHETTV